MKNSQRNLEKEEQVEELMLPDQSLLQSNVIMTVRYWHKHRHREQWNRIQKGIQIHI